MEKRRYSKYSDDEIAEAILNTQNFIEASELLGVNRKTVMRVASERGLKSGGRRPSLDHDKILNKVRTQRLGHIRRYIIKHDLMLPYVCIKCNQGDSWQGEELVLELDHINGDPCDNRLDNLRWLCPNCHTQTPTWRGKARK